MPIYAYRYTAASIREHSSRVAPVLFRATSNIPPTPWRRAPRRGAPPRSPPRVLLQPPHRSLRDAHERGVHAVAALRRGLEERHAERSGQRLAFAPRDDPVAILAVVLVPDERDVDALARVLLDVGHPVADVLEAPPVGDVVRQENAHRAAVIRAGDGPEPLLARGVPDLQLHALALQVHGLDLEVDADGGDERRRELVVGEAEKQARLAHAAVADEQELHQVVILRASAHDGGSVPSSRSPARLRSDPLGAVARAPSPQGHEPRRLVRRLRPRAIRAPRDGRDSPRVRASV